MLILVWKQACGKLTFETTFVSKPQFYHKCEILIEIIVLPTEILNE